MLGCRSPKPVAGGEDTESALPLDASCPALADGCPGAEPSRAGAELGGALGRVCRALRRPVRPLIAASRLRTAPHRAASQATAYQSQKPSTVGQGFSNA